MPAPPKDVLSVRARDDQVVSHINKMVGWMNTSPLVMPSKVSIGSASEVIQNPLNAPNNLSIESQDGYLMLSSKSGSHLAGNAWWDGTDWQRYDPAQASAIWIANGGGITYNTAPAGTGVLTVATKMTIDLNGTLISNTGDLKGQSVYAKGGYLHTTDTSNGIVYSDNGHLYLRAASGLVVMDGGAGLQVTSGHTMLSQATGGIGSAGGSEGQLELQNGGSGASKIAFHRVGAYAAYLGIDTDNQWAVGGWSMGAVRYVLITDAQAQTMTNKSIVNGKMVGPSGNFNVYGNDLTNYAMNQYAGTVTLPTPSAAYNGVFRGIKAWTVDITVNCATACMVPPGSAAVVSSFVLRANDSLTMWCDGATWFVL